MKKKLEADLISIAHRILKLKNKSDINQLYIETQKLYEKLAVLKFVDENFDTLKPTIGHSDMYTEIESIFEKEEIAPTATQIDTPIAAEETPIEKVAEPEIAEEVAEENVTEVPEETIPEPNFETNTTPVAEIIEEPTVEKIEEPILETKKEVEEVKEVKEDAAHQELSFTTTNDLKPIPDFAPAFKFELEEEEEENIPKIETSKKATPMQISFEDIMGINYAEAQFVKVDSIEAVSAAPSITEFKEIKVPVEAPVETAVLEVSEPKTVTLNEKLAKGFHVDLNDRIAFTKNLFGNNSEDYSRVLNQLLTFDTYGEAQEFIENMVKPDYNNWEGKDDYAERFLAIVEKKFS